MDMVSHATNDDGVKLMGTCNAAHVAPRRSRKFSLIVFLRFFVEKTTWRKTHMWVWRIWERHSKLPAKCRPSRGSEFGTLTRHGMPGSHHIVPRDAARTTGLMRVGGRLP